MASQAMPPSTKKEYKFTTSLYPPLTLSNGKTTTTIIYPTPSNPNPATNNPIFTQAMHIRHAVFVQEQHCRAEEEIDDDDGRSWGWVVYASELTQNHRQEGDEGGLRDDDYGGGDEREGEGKGQAVGTIRLVPPPHISHTHLTDSSASGPGEAAYDFSHEPYIKITRVAVLAPFRGYGLSRLLMRIVEDWAAQNKAVIDQMYSQFAHEHWIDAPQRRWNGWNGLIGLHAQVQVERMYAAMGYETDEAMGRWDEEGIEHVGMFKRVAVTSE